MKTLPLIPHADKVWNNQIICVGLVRIYIGRTTSQNSQHLLRLYTGLQCSLYTNIPSIAYLPGPNNQSQNHGSRNWTNVDEQGNGYTQCYCTQWNSTQQSEITNYYCERKNLSHQMLRDRCRDIPRRAGSLWWLTVVPGIAPGKSSSPHRIMGGTLMLNNQAPRGNQMSTSWVSVWLQCEMVPPSFA